MTGRNLFREISEIKINTDSRRIDLPSEPRYLIGPVDMPLLLRSDPLDFFKEQALPLVYFLARLREPTVKIEDQRIHSSPYINFPGPEEISVRNYIFGPGSGIAETWTFLRMPIDRETLKRIVGGIPLEKFAR